MIYTKTFHSCKSWNLIDSVFADGELCVYTGLLVYSSNLFIARKVSVIENRDKVH